MKRPQKRLTVKGLFLWKVQLETVGLWITTRRESLENAIDKARTVVGKEFPDQKIRSVASHGTLDA